LEQSRSKEKRKRILDVSGKVRRNRIVRDVDGRKRLGEEKERVTEGVYMEKSARNMRKEEGESKRRNNPRSKKRNRGNRWRR